MTVRVSREFVFDAEPDAIWEFISDPAKRADAISVVESYEVHNDRDATWHVTLPIPVVRSTIEVETEEIDRDPPRYVKFTGRSRAFRVTGEHTIEEVDGGTRLRNEFVVDGRLPGVESFFERRFDGELENLEAALRADVEAR